MRHRIGTFCPFQNISAEFLVGESTQVDKIVCQELGLLHHFCICLMKFGGSRNRPPDKSNFKNVIIMCKKDGYHEIGTELHPPIFLHHEIGPF